MNEKKSDTISIVVPCFNEGASIPAFYNELTRVFGEMDAVYELIFIDDGSSDDTLFVVKSLAKRDENVKFISFSRNFGKEAAMLAGLEASTGDYAAVMDADLQDPPALLKQMYAELKKGVYDCIATRRATREGEPKIRSFFARLFYKIINKISSTEIVDGARDYRLMTRSMVDAVLSLREYNRFSKGIFSWVGFKTHWISYQNIGRSAGETKWSFSKLLLYSLDGIMAFSTVPLSIASVFGLIFCLIAVVLIVVIVAKTLIWGDPVAGYPSMMCVIFLLSGVQLFSIGVIGQYLSKTYMETKRRPIYITRETNIENMEK
ncbi:MAG TPA: glycosyltransferase family 2 protein [Candidatus Ornithomonoglobus intestinigallinarum]|uniref:Glycosyltransferase family 2 protein n=1 Tax=Candidatus Ornithomonoglobus intestinigallinarum TaxID=2840894 RepID=A0A9D1KPS1_9FIRM|nr:glycosyltransferase family 2 protein [Candidatus Ornithomonoglobus intestinigallinarum]